MSADKLDTSWSERPYRYWSVITGFWNPLMTVQIHPFAWGLGAGFGGGKVAIEIGPISLGLWLVKLKWSHSVQKGRAYVD